MAMLRAAVRHRWLVVGFWVSATIASVVLLPSLASVVRNDTASFLPADAPSVVAAKLAAPFLNPSGATGVLVAADTSGGLTPEDLSAIRVVEARALRSPLVTSIGNGAASVDGQAFSAQVHFAALTAGGGSSGRAAVSAVRDAFRASQDPRLSLHLTGSLPILIDQQAAAARTEAVAVVGTILLIIVLLALAFRAVLAPLVALAPAGLALALAGPLIADSTHVGVQISSLLQLLLTALVLGAGTDYGLFLLFRYRENLAAGMSADEAIVAAGGRVGRSITYSALTVIGALLSLLLASFGLYRGVGPGLAIGIAVVLVVELTLLPALLSLAGPRVFWPSRIGRDSRGAGLWGRIAGRVVRHPVRALVGGVVILGGLSAFLIGYAPSGFNPGAAITGSDSSVGQADLADHFGEIALGATDVVFRFPVSVWTSPSLLDQAEDGLRTSGRFATVAGPLDAGGSRLPPFAVSQLYATLGPPQRLPLEDTTVPGRLSASTYAAYRLMGQYVTEDGRTVLYQTSLRAGSAGSTAAMQAIPPVRAAVAATAHSVAATRWGVTGQAPGAADVSTISGQDVVRILPIVGLVLALLLGLLLRSLVAPLYLVASVLLSYTASLGLAVFIFVTVGGQLGINFTLPFFMFVFIMALGEDYNILVMSRIKEETAGLPLRASVPRALATTGTTVTTAGLILAGTFGVLAVTTTGQVRQIGTGLALGILLDTFLVRTLLVPSAVVLLGAWNWRPLRPWTR
ncbi:MAG TPA: MMPL family transporter [Acidimicrobiales bacterium]|nr:MMPL family transporter [Acidimicrobiales bacterium]